MRTVWTRKLCLAGPVALKERGNNMAASTRPQGVDPVVRATPIAELHGSGSNAHVCFKCFEEM